MDTHRLQNEQANQAWGFEKLGIGVLLYAYAVLLGACYLFAFWRPIGFNIFPYLALQDFVTAPLNRVSVLVATPIVFALITLSIRRAHPSNIKSDIFFYLLFLYVFAFLKDLYEAIFRYVTVDFHYTNELNVLVYAVLLFCAGISATYYAYQSLPALRIQIAALVLVQSSVTMVAGYSDGKAVYNGAAEVHFLGNKELCEPGGLRDWVLLGSFGGQTFFMNTIDKRLCLTTEKNIKLVSRQRTEGL